MYTRQLFIKDRQRVQKKGKSSPWLVTFADMSILLMTFFIILLTFANMDLQKFRKMLGSIQYYFGIRRIVDAPESYKKPIITKKTREDRSVYRNHPRRDIIERQRRNIGREIELERMLINIMKFIKDSRLEKDISISKGKKGIRLRVTSHLLFDKGEAELKEGVFPLLDKISEILLNNKDYFLIVEGHTDSTPINSRLYPSNWELSGARASVVIRYLIEKEVPSERLTGIGFSSNYPLFPNNTPENQAKNRRVELIITNISPRVIIE